jgi:hypothetical protein
MTYLLLNVPFLAVAGLVALAAVLARRAPRWRAIGLAAVVLLVLTAVFDNVLVATASWVTTRPASAGARRGGAHRGLRLRDRGGRAAAESVACSVVSRRERYSTPLDSGPPHDPRPPLASRPLSWVNTAFPFAAAYLVSAGRSTRRW